MNEENKLIGAVDRNWVGFGRDCWASDEALADGAMLKMGLRFGPVGQLG